MTAEVRFTDGEVFDCEQVRILNSGWVKATETSGADCYFPPHRIENVNGRVYTGNGDRR